MIVRLPLMFILLSGFAQPVFAEPDYDSGNYMLPVCKTLLEQHIAKDVWAGQCAGIVSALLWTAPILLTEYDFCPPPRITPRQSQRVVVSFFDSHPEILHRPFKDLALEALRQAWPCPRK